VALRAAVFSLALTLPRPAQPEDDAAALRRACEAQDLDACARLAFMQLKGEGMPADASAAARLYRKACDRDDAAACGMLGSLRGGVPDAAQAVREYDAACEEGHGRECFRLGHVLGDETERGAAAFLHACERGAAKGCFWVGQRHEQATGVPKDLARAAAFYQKGCEGGDPETCVNLALLYVGGGLPEDPPRAAAILERGCSGGSGLSCFNLASFHASGTGVPKDAQRAAALLGQACRLGFRRACDPDGIKPVPTPAPVRTPPEVAQLQSRCERREAGACTTLATLYVRGVGVAPDLSRASGIVGEACLGGDDQGCEMFLGLRKALAGAPWDTRRVSEFYLGRLHEAGRGVARDARRALEWYQEACKGGESRGCDAAARMGQPAR